MTRRSWLYIGAVFGVGSALAVIAGAGYSGTHTDWRLFALLLVLATVAQVFRVEAANHQFFSASPMFFFAGTLLLPPLPLLALIAIPHAAEWIREWWKDRDQPRVPYLQPFSIAVCWIAARAAHEIYAEVHGRLSPGTVRELVIVLVAGLVYVVFSRAMVGTALVLSRTDIWQGSTMLDFTSLISEYVLICMGSVLAALWVMDPPFIIPALAPMLLIYRALAIPQLEKEAQTDAKTGLFNARHFAVSFGAELGRAQRFDRPLAFLMADLDLLRDINNTHGHLAGDEVLAGVAGIIRSTMRDYDIAGRFGGEEFCLVLPETDDGQARAIAERLRQRIESTPFTVATSPTPVHVTISIGVACSPRDGKTSTEIMHAADRALYAAKSGGRNRVVCTGDPAATSIPSLEPVPDDSDGMSDAVALLRKKFTHPPAESVPTRHQRLRSLYVGAVILAGMIVVALGALLATPTALSAVVLLALLAAAAEVLEVDLHGKGTVSVSVGITFTAAVLSGVLGLICVSGVVALVHHLQQRRGFSQLHRAFFNASAHVLAGLAVITAFGVHHYALRVDNLPVLVPVALVGGIGYFLVETGLVAIAVALSEGKGIITTWRTQYEWLVTHYLVLCLMGLVLSVTYTGMGPLSALVLTLPLFMMHYVQKQHTVQARENLTTLQQLNRELASAVVHDQLTGLGNDRGYGEHLHHEVARAVEARGSFTLVRLNVDAMKAVNEQYGRRHGDRVLRDVAEALRNSSSTGGAFRLAGDDFAMLIRGVPVHEVALTAESLRQRVERRLGVTVSIGIAALEDGGSDADLLHEQAVEAMLAAKRRGRNAVITFDEIRSSIPLSSSDQAQALRRILAAREVTVAVQPIWDLSHGTVLGYEALARFPEGQGFSGPQEVFDVAQRLGRSHELDAVCREAILARAGELPPDTRLFINLLPETLERDCLPGTTLVNAVTRAGLRPEQVVLELTERSITRLDTVIREAQRLRDLGFRLALDDAGSGNAGLNVLSHLQLDFVKLDRAVVHGARTDHAARAVLAGIIAVAREMGASVIAEGIETVETLQLVHDIVLSNGAEGSRFILGMQGYLLGRPAAQFLSEELARATGEAASRGGLDVAAFLNGAIAAIKMSTAAR